MYIFTEIKEKPKKYLFILICSFLIFTLLSGIFFTEYDRLMYIYPNSKGYPEAHYIGHTYSLTGKPIAKITESRLFNDNIYIGKGEYRGKYRRECYACKSGHYYKGEKQLLINFPIVFGIATPASLVSTWIIGSTVAQKRKKESQQARLLRRDMD